MNKTLVQKLNFKLMFNKLKVMRDPITIYTFLALS